MMISATELTPQFCLDCQRGLAKPKYGDALHECKEKFGIYPYNLRVVWSDRFYIVCTCGAVYMWSYDETGFNGGLWKRRHILPLFDDIYRIEITKHQMRKHLKIHSAIYSPDLLTKYRELAK